MAHITGGCITLYVLQASSLFKEMARGGTVTPTLFLMALRQSVPQFNAMSDRVVEGKRVHAQQDAEECWRQVCFEFELAYTLPHDADVCRAPSLSSVATDVLTLLCALASEVLQHSYLAQGAVKPSAYH